MGKLIEGIRDLIRNINGQKTKIFGGLLLIAWKLSELFPQMPYWEIIEIVLALLAGGGWVHAVIKGIPDKYLPEVLRTGDGTVREIPASAGMKVGTDS